jgi:hypothetical protein
MKPICVPRWPACLLAATLAMTGCAARASTEHPYSVIVEGTDTTGSTVRIQTEQDSAPRLVTVPFKEQWGWNWGCFRAKVQRTVVSAEDQGELKLVISYDAYYSETKSTADLLGTIDLRLCFDFPPYQTH